MPLSQKKPSMEQSKPSSTTTLRTTDLAAIGAEYHPNPQYSPAYTYKDAYGRPIRVKKEGGMLPTITFDIAGVKLAFAEEEARFAIAILERYLETGRLEEVNGV